MIYDNNKQLYTVMGGKSQNLSTDFEVRKAILELLGGDADSCASIYDIDLQILKIYEAGGGGTGGDITLKPITITENGVYNAGVGNGYNEVTVNVEIPECPEIPLTAITINSNGTYIPEEGGYNEVIVAIPFSELVATENGVYYPENGAKAFDKVTVAVEGTGGEIPKVKVNTITVSNDCIVDGTWNGNLIDTSNVTNMSSMFNGCNSLQSVDISGLVTSNVTNMSSMFYQCNALQTLDVSNLNTSKVNSFNMMFYYCNSLQTLDLSNFDTSNVTNMYAMFGGCSALQTLDVSNLNTSNVTDMESMFGGCSALQTLDVSNLNTSKIKKMNSMFSNCSALQTLDLSNFDTSNVNSFNMMFFGCSALQTLDLSNFDTSNVTNVNTMFSDCNKLTTLIGCRTIEEVISNNISALNGLKVNIILRPTIIDRASLRAIINGLADLTGSSTQTLTLGDNLMAKLTEEDIAVATAKNWTIS